MTGKRLLALSEKMAPEMINQFDWLDIWERPIENGASYEWTTIAALIDSMRDKGYNISFPCSNNPNLKSLFVLRNEVPYQHAAQAGHSLEGSESILAHSFMASLLPKVVFKKENRSISLFTEGYPYHKLMSIKSYSERPDIILVEGEVTEGFPELNGENSRINFSFTLKNSHEISGQLRTIKSSVIPLTRRIPLEGCEPAVLAVIETSVNKSYRKAHGQLARYSEIFSNEDGAPELFLVSGNNVTGPSLNSYFTDFTDPDILTAFRNVSSDIISRIGL